MDERNRHELSDQAWAALQAQNERLRPRRGRPALNERLFFEAACWMRRAGAPWRDLPCKFGPWQRTYKRFSRWTSVGLWAKLYRAMRGSEQKIGHFASLDSTSVRVHQHGAPTRTERDVQAVGISRGGKTTKVHLLA